MDAAPREAADKLPFGYAKTHGVVIDPAGGHRVFHSGALPVDVLLELRRRIGPALELQALDDASFQHQLSRAYQRDNSEAE